jgi:Zn-dependent protease
MLTGFGGHCAWQGDVSPLGRAAIACGGVAAQLLLLFAALALDGFGLVPVDRVASTIFFAATVSNAWLIGLNLLPISPLDGAEAWGFPFRLGQVARRAFTRFGGNRLPTSGKGTKEQAKNLAAQLLENARKEEDPP